MKEFEGRTAVITGAASGIGLALARRFAVEGMNLVLADIDAALLAEAADGVETRSGAGIIIRATDVTSPDSVRALAETAVGAFGDVHVLCNNAGVLRPAVTWNESLHDAHHVMDVNYWGVVHGVRSFVPMMLAHGEECHVINTASAGGLVPLPGFPSYCASKFAVVGFSEALRLDIQARDLKVGVSVICPGGVATNIFARESARRRTLDIQDDDPDLELRFSQLSDPKRKGKFLPEAVADFALAAVRQNRFYVLPLQPELKELVRERLERLVDALRATPPLPVTE